jgi:transaldolase
MVEVWLDSADINEMIRLAPKVSGFTTNPTLMRKANVHDYKSWAKIVLDHFPDKPVSFEVIGDDWDTIYDQAIKLSSWGENVYVKIPIVLTNGVPMHNAVKALMRENVKVNVTAVMEEDQMRALAHSVRKSFPAVVSIFAGRIADTGRDPVIWMNKACEIFGHLSEVKILWASAREVLNVKQAAGTRCHIITLPPDLIAKLDLVGKDLTQFSIETSQMFYNDAQKAGYVI